MTTPRIPWTEILAHKADFIGGQVESSEPMLGGRGLLTRAEIKDISYKDGYVRIELGWSCHQRLGPGGDPNAWYRGDMQFFGGTSYNVTPQEDGTYLFGMSFVTGEQTLYPKGHPKCVNLKDVLSEAA